MKLTEKAIQKLKTKSGRRSLMIALDFTELWVNKTLDANKVNGPLTTESALRAIEKETGLTRDEILEATEMVAGN